MGRFINADDVENTISNIDAIKLNSFAYCNNDIINNIDPDGNDAIWLQDTNAVYGQGHTGLLIQDCRYRWWHFYWSNKRGGSSGKKGTGNFIKICKNSYISSIDKVYKSINGGKYERIIYLAGNFSNSLGNVDTFNKRMSNLKYNLFTNNCMQVSIDLLLKGSFRYYDKEYKILLKRIRQRPTPNAGYNRFLKFHNLIQEWLRTPSNKTWKLTKPIKAAQNY